MTARHLLAAGATLLQLLASCTGGPSSDAEGNAGRGDEAARSSDVRGSQLGARAPQLVAQTLDGTRAELDSLVGNPVLLNVWATWCHPCRDEIPVLQALHERFGPAGLRVVGVSIDAAGRTADIGTFVREYGVTYPIWHDPDQRVMPAFSVIGVPTTVLIDAAGRVRWRKTGEVKAGDAILEAVIDSALATNVADDAT